MALLMAFPGLPQQFGRLGSSGAFHLVLQGYEGPPLIAETLNPATQGLNCLAELGVALCLRFCAFDDEFGEVFVVAFYQADLLCDLGGKGCNRTLLFQFRGDTIRNVRDRISLARAGLLEAAGAVAAQLGEVDRAFPLIVGVGLENDPFDFRD